VFKSPSASIYSATVDDTLKVCTLLRAASASIGNATVDSVLYGNTVCASTVFKSPSASITCAVIDDKLTISSFVTSPSASFTNTSINDTIKIGSFVKSPSASFENTTIDNSISVGSLITATSAIIRTATIDYNINIGSYVKSPSGCFTNISVNSGLYGNNIYASTVFKSPSAVISDLTVENSINTPVIYGTNVYSSNIDNSGQINSNIINASTQILSAGSDIASLFLKAGSVDQGFSTTLYPYKAPNFISYTVSNNSTTTFVLPGNLFVGTLANDYIVFIDGIHQKPSINYTVDGVYGLTTTSTVPLGSKVNIFSYDYSGNYSLRPNIQTFTSNGITSLFNLSILSSTYNLENTRYFVFVNGIIQQPGVDFVINNTGGRSIQFTSPPPQIGGLNGTIVVYEYLYGSLGITQPDFLSFTGNGSTSAFNVSTSYISPSATNYLISLGGVVQRPEIDYVVNSVNNGTIQFTTPPPLNANAGVYYFKFGNYNSNLNIVNIISKTTPMTATGDFISLVINGNQKYIRLWEG
jgi:hypothetical protein